MSLDLSTLMVMESFVAACAGAMLLFAWSQNGAVRALALWGVADLLIAGGIFALMLGALGRMPLALQAANILLSLATGLQFLAVRRLDGRPTPYWHAFIGVVVVLLVAFIPRLWLLNAPITLAMGGLYLVAGAATLWLARSERLAARLPLAGLVLLHATMLSLGAVSTLISDGGQAPPVLSLFGLIHFESIVFALGTAVFLLAMVKERSEAAGLQAARVDPLTGIANRSGFTDTAGRMFQRCVREGSEVSVMMFDLDRFKAINDGHGHSVGDNVIRQFCELAAGGLRPNDVFGRLGGEEFAVVLPGASVEVAYVRAERIRAAVASSCRTVDGHKVNATVSCGVAGGPAAGVSLETLIDAADAALYRAKAEGRNRVWRAPKSTVDTAAPNVIRVA